MPGHHGAGAGACVVSGACVCVVGACVVGAGACVVGAGAGVVGSGVAPPVLSNTALMLPFSCTLLNV